MIGLWRKIRATGRVAEPAPPRPAGTGPERAGELNGSLQLRHVDAGSCNGCEIEIASAFGPVYDAERYGARLVASPRHADALLVTGPVTRNMAVPLRRTYEAVPEPRLVVACGDCARQLWSVRRRVRGGRCGLRRRAGRRRRCRAARHRRRRSSQRCEG